MKATTLSGNVNRTFRRAVFSLAAYLFVANFFGVMPFIQSLTAHALSAGDFVATWKTNNPGSSNSTSITIPTTGSGYNYDVDWNNDGTFDETGLTGNVTHDFGIAGTYTIRIQGDFPRIYFAGDAEGRKIIDINQWGTNQWTSMEGAFQGAANLSSISATDVPNLSAVTDMSLMFYGALNFTGDISDWDTSHITNMSSMFFDAAHFNSNISEWDTSNVTNMSGLFRGASAFNQDIGNWNTSKVVSMANMFSSPYDPSSFNQDLSDWDVSSLQSADNIFASTALSPANYDALLKKWSAETLQPNVTFGAINVKYCWSGSYRQHMIDTFGWVITGDSNGCSLTLNGQTVAELPVTPIVSNSPAGSSVGTIALEGAAPRATAPYAIACTSPGNDDGYFSIGGHDGNQLLVTHVLESGAPIDENSDNVYEVCAQGVSADGHTIEQTFTIQVTPRKYISNISFSEDDGKEFLIVDGENLMLNTNFTDGLTAASLVTLNGVALPACTSTTPFTADQLEGMGFDPALFSDDPTCYYLLDTDIQPLISDTQARIWLADGFNTEAAGSVSVNGSNTYAFNTPADDPDPETPPTDDTDHTPPTKTGSSPSSAKHDQAPAKAGSTVVKPSAAIGDLPLTGKPTIPNQPTFSGTAAPYSDVTVTVHSDPLVCHTEADADGRWSCTLPKELSPGQHHVTVVITDPRGERTTLGPYVVVVKGGDKTTVNSDDPLAPKSDNQKSMSDSTTGEASNRTLMIVILSVLAVIVAIVGGLAVRRRNHSRT
jgi:surface protein